MRATDRGRDRAVSKLRGAYLRGALSTDTFETRAGFAYFSQTADDLAGVTQDLPTIWESARRLRSQIARWFRGEVLVAPVAEACVAELPREVGQRIFIGRHKECDVAMDDLSVSRWHLEISFDGLVWEARDLASTNGTSIQGRGISAVQVHPGDTLLLGNSTLRLG